MKKNKTIGIIILVLGILSIIGAAGNGTYASYAQGLGISDITMLVIQAFLIIGGIVLIIKSKSAAEE